MLASKLKQYLDKNHVHYVSIPHASSYTAQQTAQIAHIPGKELAKTVIVKVNGQFKLIVLPACSQLNFKTLETELGSKKVELARESEFKSLFPECELGAMPPFGNLYNIETYVSKDLHDDKKIAFNGGSHNELVQLDYEDFKKLAHPKEIETH